MADSTFGTLETFMGDHEKLKAPLAATRVGTALQIAILQHRDSLKALSSEEIDRYEEYHNLYEELHPKRKPTKKKDEEADEDDEEEEDENAYKYCYWGKQRIKNEDTGKMEEVEGEWPKKRFVTIATPAKLVLQYMINCYIDECRAYYLENDNSFPGDNLMESIQTFVFEHREDPITPFIYKVSKLYKNVDDILEDENTKGTGKLGDYIETAIKDIFDLKKSGKNTISKLFVIRETFVSFIKVLAINMMDYLWEQRSPFNLGMLLGTFRQLSRLVGGGECPDSFYDYAKMFVKENENNKKVASAKGGAASGKGKGRGRPPSNKELEKSTGTKTTEKSTGKSKAAGKASGKGKGKAAGKASAKGKGKGKGKTEEPADEIDEDDAALIDEALDAEASSDVGEGEDFDFDEFEDSPLPDDE